MNFFSFRFCLIKKKLKNQSRTATCQWSPQTVEKTHRKRLLFGDLGHDYP